MQDEVPRPGEDVQQLATLRRELAASRSEVDALRAELDETNRGVMALYSEIDADLRRSEARFRGIYDLAHSGIALVDGKGLLVECNQAFEAILGLPCSELAGRTLVDFVPLAERPAVLARIDQARHDAWRGEFPLLDHTGRLVEIAWSMSAHVEDDVVMIIATDISERMALTRQREDLLEREQAARADAEKIGRTKGELVAVLSHELRTPLNAILSWGQILQRAPAQLERGLEVIVRNAQAQSRLIADILDASRLDVGKLRLDLAPIDLAEVLRSSVETLESAFAQKSIRVDVVIDPLERPLTVDSSRLQQVIWNLLTNAIKFSDAGGRVTITASGVGERVVLSIADEGRGISAEFLPHLFERFSQSDASTNRRHGGLGLGLSIVKHLVELHGGTIKVLSDGQRRGAMFVVDLPLDGPTGHAERVRVSDAAPRREGDIEDLTGKKILVVEDDPDSLDIVCMVLRERGAQIHAARDADAALREISNSWPDVIVSDIGLPGRDGYELVSELRRMEKIGGKPRVRAVALTAFSRPQDRDMALQCGFDEHCPKPLQPAELLKAVLPAG